MKRVIWLCLLLAASPLLGQAQKVSDVACRLDGAVGCSRLTNNGSVALQLSSPGVTQTGNLNVSGTAKAGALNVPIGKMLYVDSVNGSNTTGARGTTMPFLTITAAKTAATAGDLIVVRPGTYDEHDLLKQSVAYFFEAGANGCMVY